MAGLLQSRPLCGFTPSVYLSSIDHLSSPEGVYLNLGTRAAQWLCLLLLRKARAAHMRSPLALLQLQSAE